MAYNQKLLDVYRQLLCPDDAADSAHGAAYIPFRSLTCPYCTGVRDATPKHIHPATKPASATEFWNNIIINKYKAVQSARARKNMEASIYALRASEDASSSTAEAAAGEANVGDGNGRMFVLGPMVDQSELPFRLLCRQYGATLAYTPMLHARSFVDSPRYRQHYLTTTSPATVQRRLAQQHAPSDAAGAGHTTDVTEEDELVDRPCIVQFCANRPDTLLAAARLAIRNETPQPQQQQQQLYRFDAVDLNLGCPQGIARRGHYGSFLMEDWDAIHTLVHTLHVELEVPVTAKIRIFNKPVLDAAGRPAGVLLDEALTIQYARMLRDAGAQLLCVHGRTREMKGQLTGSADMAVIRRVREALGGTIPVISNGNARCYADVVQQLRATGCEGHMCAEALLWDPALFACPPHPVPSGRERGADKATRLAALEVAVTYVRWVRRYPVDLTLVKAHIFKMGHHSYELHGASREWLHAWKVFSGAVDGVSGDGAQLRQPELDDVQSLSDVVGDRTSSHEYFARLDELEVHLRELQAAELASSVVGEQPKLAREEKRAARTEVVDVFDEEGGLGLNFD